MTAEPAVARNFYLNGVKINPAPIPIAVGVPYSYTGLVSGTGYNLTATNVDQYGRESVPSTVLPETTPGVSYAGSPMSPTDVAAIDAIVAAAMVKGKQPGIMVATVGPRGYLVKAYGVADAKGAVPLSTDDHFRIGSVTKTFVATAVLMQIDAGHLALTDTLDKFVTGVANGNVITIDHLLSMRSGVYDFESSLYFMLLATLWPTAPVTRNTWLSIVRSAKSLFQPGAQYSYSESNYLLLGLILESITGRTIQQVLTQDIITPLGLTQTTYPTSSAIPAPASQGMKWSTGLLGGGGWSDASALNPEFIGAAGALISTVGDLIKWGQELRDGTLLSPSLHTLRLSTFHSAPYAGTGPRTFGYGWGIIKIGSWFGHPGDLPGFGDDCKFDAATGTVIVTMENTETAGLQAEVTVWYNIAEYLFPGSTLVDSSPIGALMTLAAGIPSLETDLTATAPSITVTGRAPLLLNAFVPQLMFDAVSTGGVPAVSHASATITPSAGACVIADVVVDRGSINTTCTLGGTHMTLAGTAFYNGVNGNNGVLQRFILNGVTGGAPMALAAGSTGGWSQVAAVSYVNVATVGLTTSVNGHDDSPTQSASPAMDGVAVQAFGAGYFGGAISAMSEIGGTNRFLNVADGIGLAISDAKATSTTFNAAVDTHPCYWGGLVTFLAAS